MKLTNLHEQTISKPSEDGEFELTILRNLMKKQSWWNGKERNSSSSNGQLGVHSHTYYYSMDDRGITAGDHQFWAYMTARITLAVDKKNDTEVFSVSCSINTSAADDRELRDFGFDVGEWNEHLGDLSAQTALHRLRTVILPKMEKFDKLYPEET